MHIGKRLFQIGNLAGEGALQLHHALAHFEAGAQFVRVEGLDDVVVGSGFQAGGDFLLLAFGREQQKVKIGALFAGAHAAADFQPVELGHDPVNDGDGGRVFPF